MSSEANSVGQTSRASNEQLTEQTKAHGRFWKRHIAAIAIGTAIALGGIAATIATGGAFAAGAIGATVFGALFATTGSRALSGILRMRSGIQKGLENRKAEIAPSLLNRILQSKPAELEDNIRNINRSLQQQTSQENCLYYDKIINDPNTLLESQYSNLRAITDIKKTRNPTIKINNRPIN